MNVLELISLPPLMSRTSGSPEIAIGLIDGPVVNDLTCFRDANIEIVGPSFAARATGRNDAAAIHATSLASVLVAARGSGALAICPGVRLLNYPLFAPENSHEITAERLASAIIGTIKSGARIVNLSLSFNVQTPATDSLINDALDYASHENVIIVAATPNSSSFGGSVLTRHAAVIPVVAYGPSGLPFRDSNFSPSIGLRGVGAPGNITPVDAVKNEYALTGTSAATAIVTGIVALLWSEFPHCAANEIIAAVTRSAPVRTSVVPGMLNAWRAFQDLDRTRTN